MKCDPERVGAYHDGELSPQERSSFEEHLPACDPCREDLDRTRKLDLLLQKTSEGEIADRDRYQKEVRRRVQGRRGLSWMGVAALFLLGLTVWNVFEAIRPEKEPVDVQLSIRSELIRFATLEDENARQKILSRFQAQGETGIRSLVAALDDQDVRVQIAATQVLSRIRDDRVRDLLLEVADRQRKAVPDNGEEWDLEDSAVTSCLYRAMEIAERKSDAGDLFTFVEEQDGEDPEIMDALSEWVDNLLQSDRVKRQRLAIGILRRLELELPWWTLLPLLRSPELGRSVEEIFRLRTGKDFGADEEAWRRYLQEF